MFREIVLTAFAAVAFASCKAAESTIPPGSNGGPDASVGGPDASEGMATSQKGLVRFKGGERIMLDYSAAFEIPRADLCKELGVHDCVNVVHKITLGGVEPYRIGIYEPIEGSTATSPLAVDRIALTACTRRVDMDLGAPASAAIWKGVEIDDGKLKDLEANAVKQSIVELHQRLLQRNPTDEEVALLKGLYADALTDGGARPARSWAIASCFAVATSLEAVFY